MLVRKAANAAELFWSSLNEDERRLVVYGLAWVAASVAAMVARANRDRIKREIVEELTAGARA